MPVLPVIRPSRNRTLSAAALHGRARARALAEAGAGTPVPGELIERLERAVYAGSASPVAEGAPEAWIDATRRFIGGRR